MTNTDKSAVGPDHFAFLAGGGEMGERIRAFDWSGTPLGPTQDWPHSLRSSLSICLNSNFPIALYWGSDLVLLYNDEWSPIPGEKHPWALGRPAHEAWPEIWHIIEPLFRQVLTTGQATRSRDQLLPMHRHGFTEECYFDYTFSPIRGESGGVEGVFNAVLETTTRIIGERRLRTLRDLATWKMGDARSAEEACQTAALVLAGNTHDVPFASLYLLDNAGVRIKLAGHTGLPEGHPALASAIELDDSSWPFRQVAEVGRSIVLEDLADRFGALPGGAWPEPSQRAVVLPLAKPGQTQLAGFVVAGVSPRLTLNDDYRGFLDLLAGHIAAAVANARAYEAERERAERLAELDRAKTAFFSNVSHEFRTPLTLMLGPVADLLAKPVEQVPPENRQLLEVANRNGQRLLRLVNTLLDFSRIEAGRVRATFKPTDLAALTADLASNFRSACEKAGLRLTVDCPPLAQPVFVDGPMWEKIVLNLLSNAFKFTFEGELAVSLRQNGQSVELRVKDTGTGIPLEELPRIFERFHRVENARGRTHEGSGIGLALVQELVNLHGGTISVESEVGRGTMFTLALPLGSAHLPTDMVEEGQGVGLTLTGASPFVEEALRWLPDNDDPAGDSELSTDQEFARVPRTQDADRPRVVVADDNADMRRYVARLLSGAYTVEAVPDGAAAVAAVRRQAPDLVLSDVMMPQLDGFGVLRELRSDPGTMTIPVILLSARAGEESRVEGMEAGADDYLVKPFSARELLARVGALLQITRLRREASQAIRQSEERFRTLFEQSTAGIAQLDLSGRFILVNQRFGEITGYSANELKEKTCGDIMHPDDRAGDESLFQAVITTRKPHTLEQRFVRKDGAPVWVQNSLSLIEDSTSPPSLLAVSIDLSDRKRAEEAVRVHSDQLRMLAEVASRLNAAVDVPSITGIVTEEARILIGSHQAVMGFTTDQNWGQAINRVSLSDKYARWRGYEEPPIGSGIYSQVCRLNKPLRMTQAELEGHPDYKRFGTHAPNHPPLRGWLAAPLVGRDGRNIGLIQLSDKYAGEFTGEDEAILVQLAQMASVAIENARFVQDLRDGDRRKDEFLATLAHELRNPLAPLRNGLQILRLGGATAEMLNGTRLMMERQLAQMVRLIDDLLDLSRISRGKIELRKERIELAKIVQHAVETSRPAIDQAGHSLTIDISRVPIYVDADMTRLAQVFSNLLNNAAKYTENGGRIQLSVIPKGSEVLVSVKDNGIGIPARMLPLVFEMFTQVDRNLERSQGGLGIGLSIVKRLVQMHGGTVDATSEGHGLGSEFTVRLPVVLSVVPPRINAAEPARAGNSRRILVVDDNRDAAMSLTMILKLMGNETQTAHDGLEALDVAASFLPDLILLDIGMPRLNGYDTARQIRMQPWGRHIVLVALTGWGQDEDRRKSDEAGFNAHMVKPIEPAALEKLLATWPLPTSSL